MKNRGSRKDRAGESDSVQTGPYINRMRNSAFFIPPSPFSLTGPLFCTVPTATRYGREESIIDWLRMAKIGTWVTKRVNFRGKFAIFKHRGLDIDHETKANSEKGRIDPPEAAQS